MCMKGVSASDTTIFLLCLEDRHVVFVHICPHSAYKKAARYDDALHICTMFFKLILLTPKYCIMFAQAKMFL